MGSRFRDWAGLPLELLHIVLNKLASYREYRSFSLVCKPWLSVVREREDKEILSLRPLLLMTYPYLDDQIDIWFLDNIMNDRKYRLWLSFRDFKSICGSSHGWLACIDEDNNLSLLNPWSRRTISLPPLQFEFGSMISKVVLSDNPDSDSAPLVATIFGETNTLAFTKLGRDTWIYIDRSIQFFNDVIFDGGRMFAVDLYGCLISFDPRFDLPCVDAAKVERVVPRCMRFAYKAYIVRSCRNGAILLIRRGWTLGDLEVFKLVKVDKRLGWNEIHRLEDETLLVGLNHSVSVSCIGIFSALPNWVMEFGLKVDVFWDIGRRRMEERPLKKLSDNDLEGRLFCPPKLEKLFCLGDDF